MENELLIKALRWCQTRGCSKCVALLESGSCKYGGAIKIFDAAADALEAAEKRIAELEAQLPKEGEWRGGQYDFYCSQCGVYQNYYTGKTHYCPNCGAKMKGEKDGET